VRFGTLLVYIMTESEIPICLISQRWAGINENVDQNFVPLVLVHSLDSAQEPRIASVDFLPFETSDHAITASIHGYTAEFAIG